MIQLTCANCRNTLEVDDAFAGGVCRCQFCGTIQTVPKAGSRPRAPGSGGSAASQSAGGTSEEPKALYQVKSRTGVSSAPSGLEELAEVVHSSGLSGSGLLNRSARNLTTATAAQQKQSKRTTLIASVAGVVVVLLLLVIGYLVIRGKDKTNPQANGTETGTESAIPSTPSFHSIELTSDRVIYVIDRGDATAAFFPAIKKLTTRSVSSLGGDRKFEVILWNNGSDDAYPRSSTAFANSEESDKLSRWFDEVSTGQATTVQSALTSAMAQSPGEIVLITGKSDQLEGSDFAATVLKLRTNKDVKIHAVTLGDSPAGDPLKTVALESKGKFLNIKRDDLFALPD